MLKHTRILRLLISFGIVMLLAACSADESEGVAPLPRGSVPEIQLSSSAFANGESIPKVYTCDGADVSPPLDWSGLPSGVQSLALIVDDPDAPRGTWVHWVVYGLAPDLRNLPQDASGVAFISGTNDFGNAAYGGPCPPSGPAHRYFMRLYALDSTLDLEGGATKPQLLNAMDGKIIA
ncbi:MAG: YbhB/YbcL family Raf kinase inhibitor-like protein, partial [Chloroflexi bacterium]|nr:YbhB/YbcL family Raf kinase inhibitor-like protein [Chloroflexota bacterium]